MHRFKKIIHPTDLREKSRPAFEMACALARQNEAGLVVLHVAPRGVVSYLKSVTEYDEAEAQERLWSALSAQRPQEDDVDVTHLVEEGEAATMILHVARVTGADLLVIGPSDSGHVPRFWFTASTFDELLHRSPCPVLVAVPKRDDTGDEETTADEATAAPLASVGTPMAPLAGLR